MEDLWRAVRIKPLNLESSSAPGISFLPIPSLPPLFTLCSIPLLPTDRRNVLHKANKGNKDVALPNSD
ncbi:MAG: hypothetical protein JWM99_2825 [Verrucomicrobiales bacterium]|nr:hypothetical protein [Verrucomicrobiales bacterium]